MAQDVAGVFKSDDHRRILGWLADEPVYKVGRLAGPSRATPEGLVVALTVERKGNPLFAESERARVFTEDEINEVLLDLEADGYVTLRDGKAKRTAKGTKALRK